MLVSTDRLMCVLAFLFTGCLHSTAQSGSIAGTVKDTGGALIADAQVAAHNEETNAVRTTLTSATGTYKIVELPVGRYKITVSKGNLKSFRSSGVNLSVAQVMIVQPTLEEIADPFTSPASASCTPNSALGKVYLTASRRKATRFS